MRIKVILFEILIVLLFSSCRISNYNNFPSIASGDKGVAQIRIGSYSIENVNVIVKGNRFEKELKNFKSSEIKPGVYLVIIKDALKKDIICTMDSIVIYPNKISFVNFPKGGRSSFLQFPDEDISKQLSYSEMLRHSKTIPYSVIWHEKTLNIVDLKLTGNIKGIVFDSIYSKKCSNCLIKFQDSDNKIYTSFTNTHGEFNLSNIPCGLYDSFCSEHLFYNGDKDEWTPILNVLIKPDSTSIINFKNQFFGMGDDWEKKFK